MIASRRASVMLASVWSLAAAVACGGNAVIDGGGAPATPCERACERIGPCVAEPDTCVSRCEAIPEKCADEKQAFLDCTSDAVGDDCTFEASCAEVVTALLVCAELTGIDEGVCGGDGGECYCQWTDSRGRESTYSCVGDGCSCYSNIGFLGSCNFDSDACSATAAACCAQLQALVGID